MNIDRIFLGAGLALAAMAAMAATSPETPAGGIKCHKPGALKTEVLPQFEARFKNVALGHVPAKATPAFVAALNTLPPRTQFAADDVYALIIPKAEVAVVFLYRDGCSAGSIMVSLPDFERIIGIDT